MEGWTTLNTPGGGQNWSIRPEIPEKKDIFEQSTGRSQFAGPHPPVGFGVNLFERIKSIENDNKDIKKMLQQLTSSDNSLSNIVGFTKINLLPNKNLNTPLDAIVESDDGGFIARTIDIPLYGYGDDPIEAIDALKCEVESLYDELMEDDEFSDDWLKIKEFLRERVIDR